MVGDGSLSVASVKSTTSCGGNSGITMSSFSRWAELAAPEDAVALADLFLRGNGGLSFLSYCGSTNLTLVSGGTYLGRSGFLAASATFSALPASCILAKRFAAASPSGAPLGRFLRFT